MIAIRMAINCCKIDIFGLFFNALLDTGSEVCALDEKVWGMLALVEFLH